MNGELNDIYLAEVDIFKTAIMKSLYVLRPCGVCLVKGEVYQVLASRGLNFCMS